MEEYVLHKKMEAILSRVQKPARYVGGEWGSVMKDKKNVDRSTKSISIRTKVVLTACI